MDNLYKNLSIPRTILAILYEIGSGTVKSFFPHPYSHLFCNHRRAKSFESAASRLKKEGLIAKRSNSDIFYLTKKGEKEAFWASMNAELSGYKIHKQKWDGKWRIILFDIPEKKRALRDYLRSVIKRCGFKEFQKSIWVCPYKIPDFLKEILSEENILPYTRFITTTSIDFDKDLKKIFSL